MHYSVYELTAFFFIYGFLGWVSEVAFAAVEKGKFVNRGFLLGPICPIYGVGVVLVTSLLNPLLKYPVLEYVLCVVICSAVELLTGMILKALFHERFWDYSDQKFNIGGYICLTFSLLWGVVCMVILYLFHPMIFAVVKKVPHIIGAVFLSVFAITIITDTSITVIHALKIDKRMKKIDEVSQMLSSLSCHIGKEISDKTLLIKEKTEEKSASVYELQKKYKALIEKKDIVHEHLFKSFSNLKKGKYRSAYEKILNKKNSRGDN